jgi:hypothetical protein
MMKQDNTSSLDASLSTLGDVPHQQHLLWHHEVGETSHIYVFRGSLILSSLGLVFIVSHETLQAFTI